MVRCCRTKLIDFKYRYRYLKNLIINKGLLSLVGFSDCSLLELVLPLPGQCELFIVLSWLMFGHRSTDYDNSIA